jgi:addiction module HigA family antidote
MTQNSIPAARPDGLDPVHPGEILKTAIDAMPEPMTAIAEAIGVTREALYKLMRGGMPVSAAMALRLGRAFGNDPRFWLNLQAQYDLKVARLELGDQLEAVRVLKQPEA